MEKGRQVKKIALKILTRLMIIGFCVQILLGVFWACLQFPHFQEFGDSFFLLKVQETLLCDEYVGILYPILIRAALAIAKVIPLPYYCFLYALQLGTFVWAAHFFLNSFRRVQNAGTGVRIWAALSVTTLPMLMQCHLSVLPQSLAASLFLVHLGLAVRGVEAWKRAEKPDKFKETPVFRIAIMGLLWLAEELLLPEWRLFGGVLTAACGIAEMLHCKGAGESEKETVAKMIRITLISAAILGVLPMIWKFTIREGAYGRIGNTREAAAMMRYAWDDFGELYGEWPKELKDALTQEDIAICNRYPARKAWILGEKVDGVYGREKAREIYKQVAETGKRIRAKRNLKEMAKDAVGYGLAPAVQLLAMQGKWQKSYFASNYEVMRREAPGLTAVYVIYGDVTFCVALLMGIALAFTFWGQKPGKERLEWILWLTILVAAGACYIWHYVSRGGGIMDYKNALPVMALWMTFICTSAIYGFCEAKE